MKQISTNEIIKALTECFPNDHRFVTIYNGHTGETTCVTLQDILDAFNCQQAEIEELNAEIKILTTDKGNLITDKYNLTTELTSAKAEIERLQKENRLLLDKHPANTHRNCVIIDNGIIYTKTLNDYDKFLTAVSNETVKGFALDLKRIPRMWVYKNEIDNLLKEMIGE